MSLVSVSIPPTHHSNQGHVKPRSFLLSVVDFIDAIPPALLRALRPLFPRSLHLIILRLVLWLPELREDSPHLADDITRYIAGHNKAGQLTPRLSQSHGSLASSIGIRKVSFGIQTPIPSSISTSRRHDRVHSLSRFSDNTTSTSFNSDGPLLNPDVSTRPTNVSSALSTSSTTSILRQCQRYEQSSIVERRESVTTIAHSLPTPPTIIPATYFVGTLLPTHNTRLTRLVMHRPLGGGKLLLLSI
ncbi:hypothetical protein QCA50_017373 [Cerrena zonata]|uniref:Uncharacterized protein n=1 Tax=Cerrena zonata TaxID=2478898 RepID=A0AAW0FFY5_9APHY